MCGLRIMSGQAMTIKSNKMTNEIENYFYQCEIIHIPPFSLFRLWFKHFLCMLVHLVTFNVEVTCMNMLICTNLLTFNNSFVVNETI